MECDAVAMSLPLAFPSVRETFRRVPLLPLNSAMIRAQELARRNNETAAVEVAYRRRRLKRKLFGPKSARKSRRLAAWDWSEAEREAKPTRAIGFFVG